jgi:hypothetical protein
MKRAAFVPVLLCLAAVMALAHRVGMSSSSSLSSVRVVRNDVVATIEREDVRVQHQILRVPAPRAMPRIAPPAPHRLTRVTREATPHPGLMAKARRLIVGDGRYRPRPFPTVRP